MDLKGAKQAKNCLRHLRCGDLKAFMLILYMLREVVEPSADFAQQSDFGRARERDADRGANLLAKIYQMG